jgi:hypothetical protein
MRLPVSRCTDENITSLHNVPSPSTSPALSKGRTSEDTTNSSMLDLTGTKYRDFDVSLDSSLCLPSDRTFIIKRTLTSPPPRTKRKSVTFAAPLEKVVEGSLRTLAEAGAPAATITDQVDDFEYPEVAPGLAQGNESSRVGGFHCLSKRIAIEPQPIHPSPLPASPSPLSLFSSPPALYRPCLTEAPPSTAAHAKQKHRARDILLSPPTKAESTGRGNYLIPIMAVGPLRVTTYRSYDASSFQVLDEIHAIIKSNIQTRFERLDNNVVELRRQILAQTQADLTALLDE